MIKNGQIRQEARDALTKQGGGVFGITILVVFLAGVILGASAAVFVASIVLMGVIEYGLTEYFLAVARRDLSKIKVETMFSGFKNFGRALGLFWLRYLFVFLWLLLFYIPGIVKMFSYSMAYFVMIDNPHMGANDALKESQRIMKGYKGKLFGLMFVYSIFITLIGLGVMLCFFLLGLSMKPHLVLLGMLIISLAGTVGMYWFSMNMSVAQAVFYNERTLGMYTTANGFYGGNDYNGQFNYANNNPYGYGGNNQNGYMGVNNQNGYSTSNGNYNPSGYNPDMNNGYNPNMNNGYNPNAGYNGGAYNPNAAGNYNPDMNWNINQSQGGFNQQTGNDYNADTGNYGVNAYNSNGFGVNNQNINNNADFIANESSGLNKNDDSSSSADK